MEKEKKDQIESLNVDLYPDFNIEELEERLEMTKVIALYCSCNKKGCTYKEE